MKALWLFVALIGGLSAAGPHSAQAADAASVHWSQFRGPHARGVAEGFKTPERWNLETGENIRWQTPVPGLAHSCPIVWGHLLFVTSAVKEGEATLKVGL